MRLFSVVFFFVLLSACHSHSHDVKIVDHSDSPVDSLIPDHAEGFKAYYFQDRVELQVRNAWKGSTRVFLYKLYYNAKEDLKRNEFSLPIGSFAVFSTTHLHPFEVLDHSEKLKAVSNTQFIYSNTFDQMIQNNEIIDLGSEQQLDIEKLILSKIDAAISYRISESSDDTYSKLNTHGVKSILNGEYMEKSPLAQSEWIKFFGVLFQKEELADSIFKKTESDYNDIKNREIENSPIVLLNAPWKEQWFIPENKSFIAQFIQDAGGTYIFQDLDGASARPIDVETVFAKSVTCDVWINPGDANNKKALLQRVPLAKSIKAFQNNRMFNANKRLTEEGGNDYWESGIYKPQIVLHDLSLIFGKDPAAIDPETLFYFTILE